MAKAAYVKKSELPKAESGADWSAAELTILQTHAVRGINALLHELPGRSQQAIYNKAKRRGISIQRLSHGGHNPWEGQIPVPPRAHPIVREYIRILNRGLFSIKDAAERAGVSPQTISGWRYRKNPRLADIIACLNAVDYDLKIVPLEEEDAQRPTRSHDDLDRPADGGHC